MTLGGDETGHHCTKLTAKGRFFRIIKYNNNNDDTVMAKTYSLSINRHLSSIPHEIFVFIQISKGTFHFRTIFPKKPWDLESWGREKSYKIVRLTAESWKLAGPKELGEQ